MTHTLAAYLPQDRLRAIGCGQTLSDRTDGAALFADISGFTALTESLRNTLGARRGAEELTKYLEALYTALIAEVERYGGSVIDFAGDAITCWFDENAQGRKSFTRCGEAGMGKEGNSASLRAVACAIAQQTAMDPFAAMALPTGDAAALGLKISVASGPARRFVVGDPMILTIDALAGATLNRMALGERLAGRGEVLLDRITVERCGAAVAVAEWRASPEADEHFAVLARLNTNISPPATLHPPQLASETLRAWLHPRVFERETSGQGAILEEFRPCLALFVRFVGIDYDADEAEIQLDTFVRQAQAIVARHDGTFLQITIGDKGSYAYIVFGALTAHEDDAQRAVKTALKLRDLADELGFLQPLQIGLSQGLQYVGTYGGSTRCTFGALGAEVNLAARLMQAANPGEILISGRVQSAVGHIITSKPRTPMHIKGKTEPVPVFTLTELLQRNAIRLQEPAYALPMVGRQAELRVIAEKLDLALRGQGQIIGIVGEAGLGKSRLVAEAIRLARRKGFVGYGGACQSDGVNSSYLVWKSIWGAFFHVDPAAPAPELLQTLEHEITNRTPHRVNALPLLEQVLDLPAPIPDNDFTRTLDPKTRQSALFALIEDSLKAAARIEPILVVVEDLHWVDALSHDLLESLVRSLTTFPVCFVLAYRPPQLERLITRRLEALPHFTQITLTELIPAESELAVRTKLAQLYPECCDNVSSVLVEKIVARAQGNPFYIEELLNYLHDQGVDPDNPAVIDRLELPDRLQTLILSRIDQLSEHKKITLQVASIIGRLFRTAWLPGYYPALGSLAQVKTELDELDRLDITHLEMPEPEQTYLFKHIVTHEVTYESLPFTTRAKLHEQLAQYIEATYPAASWLDLLAYHYSRSSNLHKKIEYLQKAGDAAQKAFADEAALDYFEHLLPLLAVPDELSSLPSIIDLHLKWGTVLERLGKWDKAEQHYQTALAYTETSTRVPAALAARCQFALGELCGQRGDYPGALIWLEKAYAGWTALGERANVSQTLVEIGWVHYSQGDCNAARQYMHEGLALARELGDKPGMAQAINNLGTVAWTQGNFAEARRLFEESLALDRGDKRGISVSLNNLGLVAHDQRDYTAARQLYQESLELAREMGNKGRIANSLNNLGALADDLGDYATACTLYEESLALKREMGDKLGEAMSLSNLGGIARSQGDYSAAQALHAESLAIRRAAGDKCGIASSSHGLGLVALDQGEVAAARRFLAESLQLRMEIGEIQGMASSLTGLAGVLNQENRTIQAAQLIGAAESLLISIKAEMDPEMRTVHEAAVIFAKDALGEESFQAAFADGQTMLLEHVIALALRQ